MDAPLGHKLAEAYYVHFLRPALQRILGGTVRDHRGTKVQPDPPFQVLLPTKVEDLGIPAKRWKEKVVDAIALLDSAQYVSAYALDEMSYRPLTLILAKNKIRDYPTTLGALDNVAEMDTKREALVQFTRALLDLVQDEKRSGQIVVADWKTEIPLASVE